MNHIIATVVVWILLFDLLEAAFSHVIGGHPHLLWDRCNLHRDTFRC